jgi:hypothetical protein
MKPRKTVPSDPGAQRCTLSTSMAWLDADWRAASGYGICIPLMVRAMTRRWISEVPSKMV